MVGGYLYHAPLMLPDESACTIGGIFVDAGVRSYL